MACDAFKISDNENLTCLITGYFHRCRPRLPSVSIQAIPQSFKGALRAQNACWNGELQWKMMTLKSSLSWTILAIFSCLFAIKRRKGFPFPPLLLFLSPTLHPAPSPSLLSLQSERSRPHMGLNRAWYMKLRQDLLTHLEEMEEKNPSLSAVR